MNQNANKSNTALLLRKSSSVVRDAHKRFGDWHQERLHRMSPRRYYGFKDKAMLWVYPLSQYLFLASLLVLWIAGLFPWQILLGVLVLRLAWQTVCFSFLAKKFEIKKIFFFTPLFELYFLFANTILSLAALPKKKFQWR